MKTSHLAPETMSATTEVIPHAPRTTANVVIEFAALEGAAGLTTALLDSGNRLPNAAVFIASMAVCGLATMSRRRAQRHAMA